MPMDRTLREVPTGLPFNFVPQWSLDGKTPPVRRR